jgi:1-deoxyxylulose-5-phosphate synthase
LPEEEFVDYINLGKSGLKVSRLCLGTMTFGTKEWNEWTMPEAESRPVIKYALEQGINFFDTADAYSLGVCEEIVGRALRDFTRRDEIVLATKVFFEMGDKPNQGSLSRKHIMEGIDASLKRLGMDYVDLYQIHRFDVNTPVEETMEALHDVVRSGKARYIGASSMYAWQFTKMQYTADIHGWTRFVSMQNHYNLIYREEEREMIPFCNDQGVGLIPWSPLARGFLAGNRQREGGGDTLRAKTDQLAQERYYRDADFKVLDRTIQVAEKHGVSSSQIALSWVLHKSGISSPIIGVSKLEQLNEAINALSVQLSSDDMKSLEEPYELHPILGHS